eukprot:4208295-Amphidinium_carterae.1
MGVTCDVRALAAEEGFQKTLVAMRTRAMAPGGVCELLVGGAEGCIALWGIERQKNLRPPPLAQVSAVQTRAHTH